VALTQDLDVTMICGVPRADGVPGHWAVVICAPSVRSAPKAWRRLDGALSGRVVASCG
jgi:hypothetical protein